MWPTRTWRFPRLGRREVSLALLSLLLVLAGIAAFRGTSPPAAQRAVNPSAQQSKARAGEGAAAERAVSSRSSDDSSSSAPPAARASAPLADPPRRGGEGSRVSDSLVSGSVVDASGGPVEGALILVRSFASPGPLASGISDAEGRFRVAAPLGYSEVSAQLEAYSRAALAVQAPAEDVRLVLAPGAVIEGHVVDRTTGKPLPQLTVRAENRNGVRAPVATVVSQADGSFRIPSLAGGGYEVQAIGARFRSDTKWVTVDVGQISEPVELLAEPAVTLTATILASGEPCAVGALQLSGPVDATAVSNGGVARLEGLLAGSYELLARCEGAVPLQETLELSGSAVQRSFELERGLELRGSVVDRAGRGVAGLAVLVQPLSTGAATQSSRPAARQCVTDAAGEFACSGFVPGSYECQANVQGRRISDARRVVLAPGEPAMVLLTASDTASIRATLPPGARRLGRRGVFARNEHDLPLQAVQQADEFVFEHLELGAYRVYVGIGVEEPAQVLRVELTQPGQVANVSLNVPEPLAISGRVVDAARQPVPDAWVHAIAAETVRADSWDDAVLTDGSGAFTIEDLSPGRYELRATQGGGEGTAQTVAAGARDVIVSMEKYGSLAGLVTAASGEPVSGFTLQFGQPAGGSNEIVVSTGTRWTVPWLAPGEYQLVASSKLGTARAQVTLRPGASLDVPLVLTATHEGAGSTAPAGASQEFRASSSAPPHASSVGDLNE